MKRFSLYLVVIALSSALISCQSGLPEGAKVALDNYFQRIQDFIGPNFKYAIVEMKSAQSKVLETASIKGNSIEELWCIVIDQALTFPSSVDSSGKTYNEFVAYRVGKSWTADLAYNLGLPKGQCLNWAQGIPIATVAVPIK